MGGEGEGGQTDLKPLWRPRSQLTHLKIISDPRLLGFSLVEWVGEVSFLAQMVSRGKDMEGRQNVNWTRM